MSILTSEFKRKKKGVKNPILWEPMDEPAWQSLVGSTQSIPGQ